MTYPRDPFERAGAVIGDIVIVLTLGPLVYAILPLLMSGFYR